MKLIRNLFVILSVFLFCIVSCEKKPVPTPTPTKVDTVITRHVTYDTISCDTTIRDTIINLDNDLVVVGYCAYYGTKLPDPKYLTHLIYSCAELSVVNNVYQKILLFDPVSKQRENRFRAMLALKQKNPNLKVMVSIAHVCDISGNSQGGSYSALSKDPEQRLHFAQDCRALCDEYGLDGIDINWELPGISESGAACDSMVDTDNFTLLMKDLREALGPDLFLTYAGHNRFKEKYGNGWRFMDNTAVYPYISWVNVMCYGLDKAPKPQNAISEPSAFTDCYRVYRNYNSNNFPMDKFVMGVPFYTRSPYIKGEWYYSTIMEMIKSQPNTYKIKRNSNWHVPYVTRNGEMVGSFEDPESIAYKSEWLQGKGMHGMMWWDTNGDDSKHSLQKAAWNALKTKTLHDTIFIFNIDSIITYDTTYVTPNSIH